MTSDSRLAFLPTPSLVLDEEKMTANINRAVKQAHKRGVTLRPHLKTAKSIQVARRLLTGGNGPATVSTLAEAEVFAAAGVKDILYAVGIAPQKLERILALRATGCDLSIILDSEEQAIMVSDASRQAGKTIPTLIEIDSDGHRGGLRPDDPQLISIGHILDNCNSLRGVMTHAGESYSISGLDEHANFAERERSYTVTAAEALRSAGLPCPIVSVGSTPTALAARDLTGVTELRAGVFVFFDLVMADIGVCKPEEIALSVLTTVIGNKISRDWILIDAGWMALSRDRGAARQTVNQGYGVVCDEAGNILPDLIVIQTNQEHGIISRRPGSSLPLPLMPVGTRLRILPNHSCATAAQHDRYYVIQTKEEEIVEWPRFGGW